uniref:Protein kinase domain-containing protein n=1 Tax=Macrostomum lignano TaxID=282301 RepID=A0A1I8IV02_9PLAT
TEEPVGASEAPSEAVDPAPVEAGRIIPDGLRPICMPICSSCISSLWEILPNILLSSDSPKPLTQAARTAAGSTDAASRGRAAAASPTGARLRRVVQRIVHLLAQIGVFVLFRLLTGDMSATISTMPSPATNTTEQDKYSRLTVPSFSIQWAVALCTCNFIVPGLGTLMAGLSLCCPCSNRKDFDCRDTCCSACIQLGIALMQLLLTPVCLVGWIWSCVWGFAFIGQSGHERRRVNATGRVDGANSGVVVVATSQPQSGMQAVGGSSGYLNYAFHFKAPVTVHPYGPPPAYTAEAPPPPYCEAAAEQASTSGVATATASAMVQQQQPRAINLPRRTTSGQIRRSSLRKVDCNLSISSGLSKCWPGGHCNIKIAFSSRNSMRLTFHSSSCQSNLLAGTMARLLLNALTRPGGTQTLAAKYSRPVKGTEFMDSSNETRPAQWACNRRMRSGMATRLKPGRSLANCTSLAEWASRQGRTITASSRALHGEEIFAHFRFRLLQQTVRLCAACQRWNSLKLPDQKLLDSPRRRLERRLWQRPWRLRPQPGAAGGIAPTRSYGGSMPGCIPDMRQRRHRQAGHCFRLALFTGHSETAGTGRRTASAQF